MLHVDVPYFLRHGSRPAYKHIKIWGERFYIINGHVTRNNFDDRSHRVYFMVYSSTKVVILYLNLDYTVYIHRAHHAWFYEYYYSLCTEDNHTPSYLPLQKYPESIFHIYYLRNYIPCELDLESTPFCDTTILTYEIELLPSGKKIGFNLLDDGYFTIPYVIDTIPNSPALHQLLTQVKKYVWIISINGEETITTQGTLDELHHYHTQCGKCKVNISLCRSRIYQRTDIEEIRPIFDQVIPVVSHLEVCLSEKHLTPKNIGEDIKGPQRQFWKEALCVQYEKNKYSNLL